MNQLIKNYDKLGIFVLIPLIGFYSKFSLVVDSDICLIATICR